MNNFEFPFGMLPQAVLADLMLLRLQRIVLAAPLSLFLCRTAR